MRKIDRGAGTATRLKADVASNLRIGRIVEINPEGRLFVDFPGNSLGPVEARFVVGSAIDCIGLDCPVLVAFDSEDPNTTIIVGLLRDTLSHTWPSQLPAKSEREVIVNGCSMIFDASQEITFRCGRSSVVLRKDGKIVIKGDNIVTRASRANKIKGAAVMIN